MDETLLSQIVEATGLPKHLVDGVLKNWILKSGKSPQDLTLEDLREVLVGSLQDLFTEVKAGENSQVKLLD